MKLPGEDAVRAIVVVLVAAIVAGVLWWAYRSGKVQAEFGNVVSQVHTLQASSDISREASDNAGRIMQETNHETTEDRRALAAARAPGATAADRRRVLDRARQAYAEGQDAACRLQRADCGPAPPAGAVVDGQAAYRDLYSVAMVVTLGWSEAYTGAARAYTSEVRLRTNTADCLDAHRAPTAPWWRRMFGRE